MNIEYEATFKKINRERLVNKLEEIGATLKRENFLQKRKVFKLAGGDKKGFGRVRDEGNRITMTIKHFEGEGINRQKESEVVVDDFNQACNIFEYLGLTEKAYQESKREIWEKDGVEVMIDEWPFLEPFVEIEGDSEQLVRDVSESLGFNWEEAIFDAVTIQYKEKYGISEDIINNKTPRITFDMENPFIK